MNSLLEISHYLQWFNRERPADPLVISLLNKRQKSKWHYAIVFMATVSKGSPASDLWQMVLRERWTKHISISACTTSKPKLTSMQFT